MYVQVQSDDVSMMGADRLDDERWVMVVVMMMDVGLNHKQQLCRWICID